MGDARVRVYRRRAETVAEIGPMNAHEKGDVVNVPARSNRDGTGFMPSFVGIVRSVGDDGVALVTAKTEDE